MLNVKLNLPPNNEHIENIAFIKALLIKKSVDIMNISQNEKKMILDEVLRYLEKN